jgi:hypothetical protein
MRLYIMERIKVVPITLTTKLTFFILYARNIPKKIIIVILVVNHHESGIFQSTLANKSPKPAGLKICRPEYVMICLERIAAKGAM